MATNLANTLFSYSLFNICNVWKNHMICTYAACNLIETDFLVYIATKWYLFDKFCKIIIDIDAFKLFIASDRQFIAYIRDIKYTAIDITKAIAIYLSLSLGLILFIGFVIIKISIKQIEFYIVKAELVSLFFLEEMD